MSRVVEVVVTYLEMVAQGPEPRGTHRDGISSPRDDQALGAFRAPGAHVELRPEHPPDAASTAAAMYRTVGANFHWLDRVAWTDEQWRAEVDRDGVELWTARIGDEIAGYFQLHVESDAVELKYFGLTPQFIGRGLGGALLSAAVRRARSLGSGRVTVSTCTLDHPAALPNYLARGFRVVRTAVEHRTLPA